MRIKEQETRLNLHERDDDDELYVTPIPILYMPRFSTRSLYRYCTYNLSTQSELLQQATSTNCELLSELSFLPFQMQNVTLDALYTKNSLRFRIYLALSREI